MVDATESLKTIVEQQQALPPAAIHLGQALMGLWLLQGQRAKLKHPTLSLSWNNRGPFGQLYADSQSLGQARVMIHNPKHYNDETIEIPLGGGELQVIIWTGGKRRQSLVSSQGDVVTDLLEYLDTSEQRRCALGLYVKQVWNEKTEKVEIQKAMGYLLEILPFDGGVDSDLIADFWESTLADLGPLGEWGLRDEHVFEDMLASLMGTSDLAYLIGEYPVKFECACSKDRAEKALTLSLNENPDSEMAKSREVKCEFCGKTYEFK